MNTNIVVIPAYNPGQALLDLVRALLPSIYHVVVVNDGSSHPQSDFIFNLVSQNKSVTVLKHEINLGKGAALKTGFKYCLEHFDFDYILTADADGQHLSRDVIALSDFVRGRKSCPLVLGERDFFEKVPMRSRLGNALTSWVFGLIYGVKLSDTQTGLRAIREDILSSIVSLRGDRYEFESDMLVWAIKNKVPISTIKISTVYLDGNSSSHFMPIADSIRIYRSLFGFLVSSFISFFVDYFIFSIVYYNIESVFFSVLLARLISGWFNFRLNRKLLLGEKSKQYSYMFKYLTLFIFIMFMSYLGTFLLVLLDLNVYIAKILTDILLFFVSYAVQRNFFMR